MTRIWWLLTQALKSFKIYTFIGSYCAKYLMFDLKKYRVSYLKNNWLVVWKMTWGIWQIFTGELGSLKNFSFNGLLLSKVYIVGAKKVQRSYLSWHWRVMQNLKRNWLVFSKLTWGIWLILMWAFESLKICTWWVPFVESIYNFRWKSTEELSFMTLERNRLAVSKLTRRIWKILSWALESLKNFHFNGLLLSKVYIVWAKTVQRSYLSWHWRAMRNLKRNWLVVSKLTWEIWQILTRALGSLKKFHFNVLLLGKVYIVWAKKVQRSYLSWHCRVMQNLKKNWLVVWKMTWGI